MKQKLISLISFVVSVWVLSFIFYPSSNLPLQAQGTGTQMSGWAWSDNIGWISFNSSNANSGSGNYWVAFDPATTGDSAGLLSGYAWANPEDTTAIGTGLNKKNIGWITFNQSELAGCPQAPCEARLTNGNLTGWARAISPAQTSVTTTVTDPATTTEVPDDAVVTQTSQTSTVSMGGATFKDGQVLPALGTLITVYGAGGTQSTRAFQGLCNPDVVGIADFKSGPSSICQALEGDYTSASDYQCVLYSGVCAFKNTVDGQWYYFANQQLGSGTTGSNPYTAQCVNSIYYSINSVNCVKTVTTTTPSTTTHTVTIPGATREVTTYDGGWDGWISLSGNSHDATGAVNGSYGPVVETATGLLKGWAWGSDVIGWISFNPFDNLPGGGGGPDGGGNPGVCTNPLGCGSPESTADLFAEITLAGAVSNIGRGPAVLPLTSIDVVHGVPVIVKWTLTNAPAGTNCTLYRTVNGTSGDTTGVNYSSQTYNLPANSGTTAQNNVLSLNCVPPVTSQGFWSQVARLFTGQVEAQTPFGDQLGINLEPAPVIPPGALDCSYTNTTPATTIANNTSKTFYNRQTGTSAQPCLSKTFACTDGVLSPSASGNTEYIYTSCRAFDPGFEEF